MNNMRITELLHEKWLALLNLVAHFFDDDR